MIISKWMIHIAIFEVGGAGRWIGKTIGELDIRKKYSISILAIKTDGKMNMAIGPDMELSSEDTLWFSVHTRICRSVFGYNG